MHQVCPNPICPEAHRSREAPAGATCDSCGTPLSRASAAYEVTAVLDSPAAPTVLDQEPPPEGAGLERASFGPFVDSREIGRGGMAVVLEATDPRFDRRVALKVLPARPSTDRRLRFLREARVTAQLEHPNIVPVHDIGQGTDESHYFAMKRVRGRSLLAILEDDDRPRVRLLSDFLKVCDAVAFAHSRGVIHRDLKPENVMIGEFGEVLVMDWGLAKLAGRSEPVSGGGAQIVDPLETRCGEVLGTPAYMAPEQASGRAEAVDERTDVYALGALLYQILTGTTPHGTGVPSEMLLRIASGVLEPPTSRAPGRAIPRELEAVVLRAMAADPAGRYPGVVDLAADIEAYLAGRALSAADYTLVQLARKWIERHRGPSAVAAVALVLLLALAGASYWRLDAKHREATGAWRAEAAKRREVERLEEDRRRHHEAQRLLERARADLDRVRAYLHNRNLDLAEMVLLVERARQSIGRARAIEPDLAGAEFLDGWALHLLGREDEAVARWSRAIELDGDHAGAHHQLGRAYLVRSIAAASYKIEEEVEEGHRRAREWSARAAREFEAAVRVGEGDELLLAFGRAVRAYLAGDLEPFHHLLDEAIDRFEGRDGVEELHWLRSLDDGQSLERRVADLDRAIDIRPRYAEALLFRAILHGAAARPEEALADLDEALRIHPLLAEGYYRRARVEADLGRGEAAIDDYTRAVDLDPGLFKAFHDRGVARWAAGDIEGALADYAAAIDLAPDFARAHLNRGLVLGRLGRREEALAAYGRVIEIGRGDLLAEAHHRRGLVRVEMARYPGAIDDFTESIRRRPGDPRGYHNRGTCRLRTGDRAGALADFEESVRVDPGYLEGYLNRAIVRAQMGEVEAARADVRYALERAPADWIRREWATAFLERLGGG